MKKVGMGICIIFLIICSVYGDNNELKITSKDPQKLVALLSNPESETRAAAAAELLKLIAANPTAKSNDHGEEYWEARVKSVMQGMKHSDVIKLLPAYDQGISLDGTGNWHNRTWRLDHYWIIIMYYRNPDTVIRPLALQNKAMRVWVDPPADFTGTWVTWHVNGQKSHEIDYKNGKFHGSYISYHDNGQMAFQHHFRDGVNSGPAYGWHKEGSKAYIGTNKDGKPEGTWIFWNENGSVDTIEYKNGVYVP